MSWDRRFLKLAEHISGWSKDPSTKCGAVIVRPNRTIASTGYNGFPRGCLDDAHLYADRNYKYPVVVHAEANAITTARTPLDDCTIYLWTGPKRIFTCASCAGLIIQSGIKRVVAQGPMDPVHWKEDQDLASDMYGQAGVAFEILEEKRGWTGSGYPLS